MRPNTLVHQQVHHLVIMVTVLEIQVEWEMYNFSPVTILRGQPSDLHFSVAPCNRIFAPNTRLQVAVVETRCPNNHVNKYKYMLTSLLFSVSASSSTCKTCDISTQYSNWTNCTMHIWFIFFGHLVALFTLLKLHFMFYPLVLR